MSTLTGRRLTAQEYLELDRASELRYEFLDGEVMEMVGGSTTHNIIVSNLTLELGIRFKSAPFLVLTSTMRVGFPDGEEYAYPDVVVVAGEAQLEDASQDTLLNPALIVEVLSPSTEAYDRGRKFQKYQQIPTLADYLLVEQSQMQVEHFHREPAGPWTYTRHTQPGDAIRLDALGCQLPLADVYAKVDLTKAT